MDGKRITILVFFPLFTLIPTLSAQAQPFCTLEPRTCRPNTEVTFSLMLSNPSGSPIWEVRVSTPKGFLILDALPPQDWGYAAEENCIVYQALVDSALLPENGKKEFEFTLQTPVLGEATEKGFKIRVSAKNTKDEVLEENLELMVDNLPPTLEVEPKILGCGEARLEILASERMGNLSACLVLKDNRIPLQLSSKDGVRFEASVRTQPGVEEPASLLIENAWDLAGNSPIENVLPLKVDTVPPKVENCWLEKGGRVIARGEVQENLPVIFVDKRPDRIFIARTSERTPEILIAVSDGSGIGDWELDIGPVISGFDVGKEERAPECEKVFENGIIRVTPKARFGFRTYSLSLKVRDRASPPNETCVRIWIEVEGDLLGSILYFGTVPLVLLIAAPATFLYCAWNVIRLWKEVHGPRSKGTDAEEND